MNCYDPPWSNVRISPTCAQYIIKTFFIDIDTDKHKLDRNFSQSINWTIQLNQINSHLTLRLDIIVSTSKCLKLDSKNTL